MLIDLIPDYLTLKVTQNTTRSKPDGTKLTIFEHYQHLRSGTQPKLEKSGTATYELVSYPMYQDETHLSSRSLAAYAELLNQLIMVQYTVITDFRATGGGVKSAITEEDFIVIKLNTLDISDCREYLQAEIDSIHLP